MKMTGLEAHLRLNKIDEEITVLTNLIAQENIELGNTTDENETSKRNKEIELLNDTLEKLNKEKAILERKLGEFSFFPL